MKNPPELDHERATSFHSRSFPWTTYLMVGCAALVGLALAMIEYKTSPLAIKVAVLAFGIASFYAYVAIERNRYLEALQFEGDAIRFHFRRGVKEALISECHIIHSSRMVALSKVDILVVYSRVLRRKFVILPADWPDFHTILLYLEQSGRL